MALCYNIIKMTKQFYNNITPIQPTGLNYERERERVKSLCDFDLEFYNCEYLKHYF